MYLCMYVFMCMYVCMYVCMYLIGPIYILYIDLQCRTCCLIKHFIIWFVSPCTMQYVLLAFRHWKYIEVKKWYLQNIHITVILFSQSIFSIKHTCYERFGINSLLFFKWNINVTIINNNSLCMCSHMSMEVQ